MWMWMFNCCKWLEKNPIHRGFTQLLHLGFTTRRCRTRSLGCLQREAALQMQRLHRGVRENGSFFCLPRSSNIWLWGFLFEFEELLLMFACFSSLSERIEKILDGSEVPKSSRWVVWVWLPWLLYLEVSGDGLWSFKAFEGFRTIAGSTATILGLLLRQWQTKTVWLWLVVFSCDFHKNQVFFGRFGGPIQSTGPRCDKDAKVCWEWEANVMSSSRSYAGDDAGDIHML